MNADATSTTILLVEDSPTVAARVKFNLESASAAVVTASGSLEGARDALQDGLIPDCVVLDLTLPDASGLDGLAVLRGLLPTVAIVVLTGIDEEELALAALRAGAQDYLIKGGAGPADLARAVRFAIERKKADAVILHQANHDLLTGLPSRRRGLDIMNAMTNHRRESSPWTFVVLFLDLDGFKPINDSLGHSAGDAVLKTVAERLTAVARTSDVICRLGGDEFLYVATGVHQADGLAVIAARISAAFAEPIAVAGQQRVVQASIGATEYRPGETVFDTVARADQAMYRAKRQGPGSIEIDIQPESSGVQRRDG